MSDQTAPLDTASESPGVDAASRELRGICHPDVEVVAAMAGSGMHKAGAGVVGDVVAVEEGDIERVAE